jgi:putative photosynthetic complex assembly protein
MKPSPRSPASRGGLIAAAGLILSALAATGAARVAQLTAPSDPPAAERPVAAAELVFLDEPDGSIQVRRDQDRRLVDLIAPTKGGFVRGVMRGFARDRMMRGIGSGPPFQLAESEGGRLTLTDLATARVTVLDAFGADNRAAFAVMLSAAEANKGGDPAALQ